MALIKCPGCDAIHDSTSPACPGCGRCPYCGDRRVSKRELAEQTACAACGVPYCSGCGRCHACGAVRFSEMGPHTCGFPANKEKVHTVEDNCGLHRRGAGGCLVILLALAFCGGYCLTRKPYPDLQRIRPAAKLCAKIHAGPGCRVAASLNSAIQRTHLVAGRGSLVLTALRCTHALSRRNP
jgi:hypothetical protein